MEPRITLCAWLMLCAASKALYLLSILRSTNSIKSRETCSILRNYLSFLW